MLEGEAGEGGGVDGAWGWGHGGGLGYHGGIVGGEFAGRNPGFEAMGGAIVGNGLADTGIGGDSTADGDGSGAGLLCGKVEFLQEGVNDGFLDRCGEVGAIFFDELGVAFEAVAHGVEEAGFESAEAVIEAGNVGFGEVEGAGISLGGKSVNVWAAGVREAHDFGALVEGLAGSVVDGFAEDFHVARPFNPDNLGVTAGNQQAEEGKFGDFLVGSFAYEMGEDVAVEMVDVEQRDAQT